ncbi:glycosyl transferase [Leifsonia sp. LS1]|uniref:glycosyltransferase family 2 protein n=1 Tax=Leifsonia sp. LS1 TaxID=2828483 RepID=UPI001CFED6ED|nr:glycosyltransferase [Leifsonia sp. LS1]GIT80781.1 glycosyl transferase [Leifsonia sp. LS1]
MPDEHGDATVVVPVGPRAEHLPEQLRALARQVTDRPLHVILACNGCPPATARSLVADTWQGPHTIEIIDAAEMSGPSYARNSGWRRSSSPTVLFCDADDIVASGWAQGLLTALGRADLVGGTLEHDTLSGLVRTSWGATGSCSLPRKFRYLPFIPSGTLGARRAALEALGGFDVGLHRGEDVDLSWRAQQHGMRVERAPAAVVHVRRRSGARALFAQAWADARSDAVLLARHRPHGAHWAIHDLVREAAGVAVAAAEAVVSADGRTKLASRSGRFAGHACTIGALARAARRR